MRMIYCSMDEVCSAAIPFVDDCAVDNFVNARLAHPVSAHRLNGVLQNQKALSADVLLGFRYAVADKKFL